MGTRGIGNVGCPGDGDGNDFNGLNCIPPHKKYFQILIPRNPDCELFQNKLYLVEIKLK
jgi:hypothetical protein